MPRGQDTGSKSSSMNRGGLRSLKEDAEVEERSSHAGSRNKNATFSIVEEDEEEEEQKIEDDIDFSPEPDQSVRGGDMLDHIKNLHSIPLAQKCQRTAMGEYVPQPGKEPLTQLALPTPGPTDYQPKMTISKPAAPQHSIVGKAKKATAQESPGPNKYNTQKDLVWKDKKITLKGKGNMKAIKQEGQGWDQSVGAAAYFVTHGNFGTRYAKYTMGLKGKLRNGPPNKLVHPVDTNGFNTPGPAEYNPNCSYWGHGAKTSFGLLLRKKVPCKSPGPAEYDIPRGKTNGPLYSFGARLHTAAVTGDSTPGPGSYHIGTTIGKSLAKSISGRQDIKKSEISPSPNTYSLPSSIGNGPNNLMTYRAFESAVESTPGPAEYTLRKDHLRKGPEFTCRKLLRHPEHAATENPDLGPNTYYPNRGISKNDKPAYSIGTRFKQKIEITPGPTTYDVKQTNRQGSSRAPAFSIGKRIEENPEKVSPGPAAYYPKPITSTTTCSISGWNRKKRDNLSNLPAANAYGVQSGQTRRGQCRGPAVTLKGRPSPYVYSGFKSAINT